MDLHYGLMTYVSLGDLVAKSKPDPDQAFAYGQPDYAGDAGQHIRTGVRAGGFPPSEVQQARDNAAAEHWKKVLAQRERDLEAAEAVEEIRRQKAAELEAQMREEELRLAAQPKNRAFFAEE